MIKIMIYARPLRGAIPPPRKIVSGDAAAAKRISFKSVYFYHGNTLPKGERPIPVSLGARRDQRFA